MAFPLINPVYQFFDNAGEPLSGGLLYTYAPGTTTNKATYTDENLSVPNANPIVLDSGGRCVIFLTDGEEYKFVLKTSAGVTLQTVDEVKSPSGLTQTNIGSILYPTSSAETSASCTIVRPWFYYGDVRRYCAANATNHEQAFIDAHAANDVIYAPAGTWNVDHFLMDTAGRRLKTDGFATIIHQRTGNINRRLIEVAASNITIDDLKVTGNIATDTGEQQHGIFVSGDHPTAASANIRNIAIGNVWGVDLRGDVVYVGAPAGFTTTGFSVGVVHGSNILRNVVSIVGASYGSIEGIYCMDAAGYATFDLEPNSGGTVSTDVQVGWIYGGVCQIAPPTSGTTARRIKIGQINLDPAFQADSTPSYTGYAGEIINGLWLRNCVGVEIEHATINNFTEYASKYVFNVGEQAGIGIRIGDLRGSNCGTNALGAFLEWSNVQQYTIGDGEVSLKTVGDVLVLGPSATKLQRGIIDRMFINGTVARFAKNCRFNQIVRNDSNDAHTFRDIDGLTVTNSDITAPRLISNVTQFRFEAVTATCATSYISGTCNNGEFVQSAGGLASICQGSATYDPANLVDGAGVTTTVTATGAVLGDSVTSVSFSLDLQGITLTAWVSAADTVSVRFQNETGGAIDLASGTIRVYVRMA